MIGEREGKWFLESPLCSPFSITSFPSPSKEMISLTVYVRKFDCSVCGKPVYWDDDKQLLSCGCGKFKASFVNLEEFIPLPKYDRKYWSSETFPIDCAKFLTSEILMDGSCVLLISDRQSIFKGNEDPKMSLRWIHYPEKDKTQLCIAISGNFHTEKIAYNQKDPEKWREQMWIYLDVETVKKMIEFLERNPQLLASWM